jgi:hypothetical protein
MGLNPTNIHDRWELDFATQTQEGAYSVLIGPHISNLATPNATEMDQNHDTIAGEPGSTLIGGNPGPGDAALGFFDIVGLRVLSISPSSPAQSLPGVTTITITFNEPVVANTFSLSDVTLTGPANNNISLSSLSGSGAVWHVAVPSQSTQVAGLYTLTVGPNDLKDAAGELMNQNMNSVPGEAGVAPLGDGFSGTFAIEGLQVISAVALGETVASPFPVIVTPPGLTQITVTFNRGVAANSFTAAQATLQLPNGAKLTPSSIVDATLGTTNKHDVWILTFPAQTTAGNYTLTLGPGIKDLSGTAMDQNQNLVPNQPGVAPVGDAFQQTFTVSTTLPPPPVTVITTPTDVTGIVTILFKGLRKVKKYRDAKGKLHRGTFFVQQVGVFNTSNTLIQGPFVLIPNLPRGVNLVNKTGTTHTQSPLGKPYITLSFGATTLASFQGGNFQLVYTSKRSFKAPQTGRLLAGVTNP